MPMETVFQRLMLLNPEGSGEFLIYQSKNRTWSYSSICHNVSGFFFFFKRKQIVMAGQGEDSKEEMNKSVWTK